LSIIENVIFAHDAEKKWLQSHPAVLYGGFLAQNIIKKVSEYYKNQNNIELFSKKSLLLPNKRDAQPQVNLLSDNDILCVAKNQLFDQEGSYVREYYSRNKWRHPIWKSEAEYRFLLNKNPKAGSWLCEIWQALVSHGENKGNGEQGVLIDSAFVQDYEREQEEFASREITAKDGKVILDEKEVKKQKDAQEIGHKKIMEMADCMKKFAEDNSIDYSFLLLSAKAFKSGFSESDYRKIQISMYENDEATVNLEEVSTIYSSNTVNANEEEKAVYYVYYRRPPKESKGEAKKNQVSAEKFFHHIEKYYSEKVQPER
jgi:hypothetical protein